MGVWGQSVLWTIFHLDLGIFLEAKWLKEMPLYSSMQNMSADMKILYIVII